MNFDFNTAQVNSNFGLFFDKTSPSPLKVVEELDFEWFGLEWNQISSTKFAKTWCTFRMSESVNLYQFYVQFHSMRIKCPHSCLQSFPRKAKTSNQLEILIDLKTKKCRFLTLVPFLYCLQTTRSNCTLCLIYLSLDVPTKEKKARKSNTKYLWKSIQSLMIFLEDFLPQKKVLLFTILLSPFILHYNWTMT